MQSTTLTEKTAVLQQKKIRGKPFKKGVSGNVSGRPKGSKSFRTLFDNAIVEIKNEKTGRKYTEKDVLKEYIQRALNGDNRLLERLVDRLYGKPAEHNILEDEEEISGITIVIDRE